MLLPIMTDMSITASGSSCPKCGCKEFKITQDQTLISLLSTIFIPQIPYLSKSTNKKIRICKDCGYKEDIILFS